MRFGSTRYIAVLALAAFLQALLPAPALAIDRNKAALAMAQKGRAAYEKADFEQAVRMYLEAWRIDPDTPSYIYSAARTEQVAGKLDEADAHYAEYLKVSEKDPRWVDAARKQLQGIRAKRLELRIAEADDHARAGRHTLAAKLYLEAYDLAADRPVLLFKAARAHCKEHRLDDCEREMKAYLGKAPADALERKDADTWLEQIDAERNPPPLPDEGTATLVGGRWTVVQQVAATPQPVSRTLAYAVAGGGIMVGLTGLTLYLNARAQRQTLDDKLAKVDGAGHIVGTTWVDTRFDADGIASQKTWAVAAGSVGLTAVGVGAWLWWLSHRTAKVAVGPGPGVGLSVTLLTGGAR